VSDSAARPLLGTRAARGVADGLVAASFAALLGSRGMDTRALGLLVTATLLGSASVLLAVTRWPAVLTPLRVLGLCGLLMAVTGLAFAFTGNVVVLVALAVVGPLNPTGGDVSAFLPSEQAILAGRTPADQRSAMFARYSLAGAAGATIGGLSAGTVASLGRTVGFASTGGVALAPLIYACIGAAVTVGYLRMRGNQIDREAVPPSRLVESRSTVHQLALLFALDASGGGFVGTALLAAWLARRFDFALSQVGLVLGLASAASAVSMLAAPRLSRRFGLVETMVFTHLPANVLCIAAGFAPTASIAVALLITRALISNLDVPARQTFVMSVVPPQERAAAAAFTNVPRSLAAASTPALAGWMLHGSAFGWPLIAGGSLKIVYDLLLLSRFSHLSTRA
jgi:predicted MFS family arabinose efflux permease